MDIFDKYMVSLVGECKDGLRKIIPLADSFLQFADMLETNVCKEWKER